jgi:hypothetical protein
MRVASAFPTEVNDAVALLLLAGATAIMAWLFVRTVVGIMRGELRNLI